MKILTSTWVGEGPFTFSNTHNKFTAIGCNFFGILQGIREDDHYMKTACLSYCREADGIDKGVCTGAGCCQFSIPNGLKQVESFTRNYYKSQKNDSCTYIFLVDKEQFTFSASDLQGTNFYERSKDIQVVVDWVAERDM